MLGANTMPDDSIRPDARWEVYAQEEAAAREREERQDVLQEAAGRVRDRAETRRIVAR